MRRHLLAAAAIAALACNRQQPAAQQTSPAPQAAAPALKEFTEPRAAKAKAGPIVIDARALDAYVAFKREMIAETRKAISEVGDRAAVRLSADPVRSAVRIGTDGEAMAQRLEARRVALLQEHGLGDEQVRTIDDLVLSTLSARNLAAQIDGGSSSTIAQIRQQIATLPAEQRSGAELEVARMERSFADMANAKAARAQFGDAAVDLVLEREQELAELRQNGLGLPGR